MTNKYSHDRLHFPSYLSKMSRSKSVRALRKSVDLKLAIYLHTSTKRVDLDVLPFVKQMMSNEPEMRVLITKELKLEPEELGFLLDKKPESKDVKAVFEQIESEIPKPEPVKKKAAKASEPTVVQAEEPVKEPEKPQAEHKKNNQASLFDF